MSAIPNPLLSNERILNQEEIRKIIGAIIGGLVPLSGGIKDIRAAIQWWGGNSEVANATWTFFEETFKKVEVMRAAQTQAAAPGVKKPD